MINKKTSSTEQTSPINKLNFLIGRWHTKGIILQGENNHIQEISGMDTYEWIPGGFFILHKVDVYMGNERTEVVEIIGYDEKSKSYFLKSFDNKGEYMTLYATLADSGILTIENDTMKTVLTVHKNGNSMEAKWELLENEKIWKPWMEIQFRK